MDGITVSSPAFEDGAAIPSEYTCEGADISPPLAWTGVPADAAALALVVDDPDAPSGTFTHWVVLDIPAGTDHVDEDSAPAGAQARNSAGRASWFGPCPPGGTHHYRFTLHALSEATGLRDGVALGEALGAIQERSVAQGRLVGTFSRG